MAIVLAAFGLGIQRVSWFTESVAGLGGDPEAAVGTPPIIFDPTMDVWFGEADAAVSTYYGIEDRFVAEDYVMVTFETGDSDYGAFDRSSLETISRLTDQLLTVPGVRHVRSLTYNPWIRWGTIEDSFGSEEGLIISDLVQGEASELSDDDLVQRMIAVLGAQRVADRLGEDRVRALLGVDTNFDDHIGEPLLLGTILDESGTTTVIQVQVLRPRVDPDRLQVTFGDDLGALQTAPNLYAVATQRRSLEGIERILRIERGLTMPSVHQDTLQAYVAGLPEGADKHMAAQELADPRTLMMEIGDGEELPKYAEYERAAGGYVNRATGESAPAGFTPQAMSTYEFHLGGTPLFERNFEEVGMADSKFILLMFLVIIIALFAVFRGLAGVIVPLAVVFGSIMAMVGANFAQGDLMNNLTMMAPNMLTAVGIADAIHLVAAWAALRPRYEAKRELITEVMRRNILPVFLTSVTTAVGFYSLTVSKLVPVQMLGAMACFGTLMAYLLSMSVVPALLSLVPHKRAGQGQESSFARFFSVPRSAAFVHAILARRGIVLMGAAGLLVTAFVGVSRVEIDSDFRAMFPNHNKTMSDFRWIEARMGGVGDVELVFSAPSAAQESGLADSLTLAEEHEWNTLQNRDFGSKQAPDEFTVLSVAERERLEHLSDKLSSWEADRIGISTEFLGALDGFERRLREEMETEGSVLSVVTDFISPLDTLRKIHQVQHENSARFYRVPSEADVPEELRVPELSFDEWSEEWTLIPGQSGTSLIAQYYLQYESGARPGESLTTQLSADRSHFRVQGRIEQASSLAQLAAFDRMSEIAGEEFPTIAGVIGEPDEARGQVADMTVSGKTLLFARTTQLFSRGFLESMSIALLAITLLIGFVFRSWRLALISLIPNLLPILLPLSVFGLLGWSLDGPAILVSSVALGVCVDDTIHFFTKFARGRQEGKTPEESLSYAIHVSGAAMTITTGVLIIGFGTLLLSDFSPNFQMGALAGLMIGLAWFFDFVVTTAVLSFPGAYVRAGRYLEEATTDLDNRTIST